LVLASSPQKEKGKGMIKRYATELFYVVLALLGVWIFLTMVFLLGR
jgi:hypothetical protein